MELTKSQKPVAINFLDGGSVPALRGNVPAWDTTSNQHKYIPLGPSSKTLKTHPHPPD